MQIILTRSRTLIQMVQQIQFTWDLIEDLNVHLSNFLDICDTIKMNGVTKYAIKLRYWVYTFDWWYSLVLLIRFHRSHSACPLSTIALLPFSFFFLVNVLNYTDSQLQSLSSFTATPTMVVLGAPSISLLLPFPATKATFLCLIEICHRYLRLLIAFADYQHHRFSILLLLLLFLIIARSHSSSYFSDVILHCRVYLNHHYRHQHYLPLLALHLS